MAGTSHNSANSVLNSEYLAQPDDCCTLTSLYCKRAKTACGAKIRERGYRKFAECCVPLAQPCSRSRETSDPITQTRNSHEFRSLNLVWAKPSGPRSGCIYL